MFTSILLSIPINFYGNPQPSKPWQPEVFHHSPPCSYYMAGLESKMEVRTQGVDENPQQLKTLIFQDSTNKKHRHIRAHTHTL